MDARLIPLNAFIGLVLPPGTSWPNPLFEAGYVLVALELPLDAAGGRVVADAVAFNPGTNRFLVVEAKSGRNIRVEQARRYGLADGPQLVRHTGVTVALEEDLGVQPVYVCLTDNLDRISMGLREAGCAYPILAVGEQEITLHGETDTCPDLASVFAASVRAPGWPPATIRVDEDSDADEFDMIAGQALLVEANLGRSSISAPDLAARAIPHLHIYGTGYRRNLVSKVEQALQRLCQNSPENFNYRRPTASRDYAVVEIVDSPERADPRGRTQRYQAIGRRFRGQPQPEPSSAQQQELFDSLDLDTELEELATDETGAARDEREEGEA